MEPLQTIQRVLTWLCGVPPKESDSKRAKLQYILLTFVVIMDQVVSTIYRNVSVDLEQTLFSLFHAIGSSSTVYQSIAVILLRYKLIAIIQCLMKIYDDSKY